MSLYRDPRDLERELASQHAELAKGGLTPDRLAEIAAANAREVRWLVLARQFAFLLFVLPLLVAGGIVFYVWIKSQL